MRKIMKIFKSATIALAPWLAVLSLAAPASALTADQTALVQIVNQYVTASSGTSQSYVSGMSVYGSWALVGWTDNTNSAGQIVASKVTGTWTMTKGGGGAYRVSELQSFAGVDATAAAFLIANFRPLPPVSGPSTDASGSSTFLALTEDCGAGVTTVESADNGATFMTPSVTPTTIDQAVTLDVTATGGLGGAAVVALYGPSAQLIGQTTIPVGYIGGLGYWNPNAPTGVYQYTITGTSTAFGDDCGNITRTRTQTDASWLGTMAW